MINYLDIIFLLFTSVVGIIVFSVPIFFIMNIGARKKTYYKMENADTYVIYKWFRGRGKGYYGAYKFKKDNNKLIFLKRKIDFSDLLPSIIILGIIFIISVIKAGLLAGFGVLLYAVLVFVELTFLLYKYNILYCKKFLMKKLIRTSEQ